MSEELRVTIRTPAGYSSPFSIDAHERVEAVTRQAVKHFVAARQLAPGEYGLALVRGGQATDLADDARLEDCGVGEADVLSLISKGPQVDG
ncbi:MAG: hypothetical protein ACRDJF_12650 [Actinomycetota bacterium]